MHFVGFENEHQDKWTMNQEVVGTFLVFSTQHPQTLHIIILEERI